MRAIIGGTSIFSLPLLREGRKRKVSTVYGEVSVYLLKDCVILNRHGAEKNIPAHRINHSANMMAIKSLGIKEVVALNSCGSLHKEIEPGTFIVPDDYLNFDVISIFDNRIKHILPGFSPLLRKLCIQVLSELKLPFRDKGIYAQTRGPRLETKAEVNFLKDYADIVGMTLAKEATIAKEVGLRYASICSVDNYANGIGSGGLSYRLIKKNAERRCEIYQRIIERISR
ncbi:MAG: hypothetical protein DRP75_02115 [Candidatus Omnitrophota bacterium]|nr:MAG: hypothetical protein DRP75_02115 [Candidatus Omnitrophota bacterium]